jgi:phospholipase C
MPSLRSFNFVSRQRHKALSRRAFLKWLATAATGLATGCVAGHQTAIPTATQPPQSTPRPSIFSPTGTIAASPGSTRTATSTSAPLATPRSSATATTAPPAAASPAPSDKIKNIIFFIQENHTFDSLFAGFPGADGVDAGQACPDRLPADPPHQHGDAFRAGGNTTRAARCSYTQQSAATYWQIARQFSLCDRFFSDVRGPSHPNYFMMTSAQTPIVNTPYPIDVCPDFCYDIPTLANRLDDAGLSWRDYGGILTDIKSLAGRPEVMDRQDAQYFADAAAGTLPNMAWLNSDFLANGAELSGHPTGSLCNAQQYAAKVINAAVASPQWGSIAMFLVWDDWGGFFDHVDPPIVEKWTDGTPLRYGFRVPCIAISPFARSGYVSHATHSFVSVLHFAETVYSLAPLNKRDANASALLDCFDFAQQPLHPKPLAPPTCG